jgi:hypothetical protein
VAATATLVYTLDFTIGAMGSGPGMITPGSEWNFQFYYRNAAAPPGNANVSDAINFGFLP